MLYENLKSKPCREQYQEFLNNKKVIDASLIPFYGVDNCDIYNPSVPFVLNGTTWMAGRAESRDGHDSRVFFFEKKEDGYHCRYDMPHFEMEDPFVTFIDDELIMGGVSVDWNGTNIVGYKTVFFRGYSLQTLVQFAHGPNNMKDIRLIQLRDRRIGIFTRPRDFSKLHEWGSYAKIGFTIVDTLEDLSAEVIAAAPNLEGQFNGEEWGGCNEACLLKNGLIGVVGHKAYGRYVSIDDSELHYYGIVFALDPLTRATTEDKIIITRNCFPDAPPKRVGLEDITFTAGILRLDDGTARVYTGLSDSAVGMALIEDPFLEWEK